MRHRPPNARGIVNLFGIQNKLTLCDWNHSFLFSRGLGHSGHVTLKKGSSRADGLSILASRLVGSDPHSSTRPLCHIIGSHPVRRLRTDVAFTIHLYGLLTNQPSAIRERRVAQGVIRQAIHLRLVSSRLSELTTAGSRYRCSSGRSVTGSVPGGGNLVFRPPAASPSNRASRFG